VGGNEILIDPGTYTYHTQKMWRDYFRGTSAHNTVRIDGVDQSVIGGNFMWLRHATAACEGWEPGAARDRLAGSHDGYMRLDDPVRHRREIALHKKASAIRVADTLECAAEHVVELHWHCHEDVQAAIRGRTVEMQRNGIALMLAMSDPRFSPRIARGEEAPPLGWVSRRFDTKQPTATIVWTGAIIGDATLRTDITVTSW
jgi:hypothetical protein